MRSAPYWIGAVDAWLDLVERAENAQRRTWARAQLATAIRAMAAEERQARDAGRWREWYTGVGI